VSPKVVVDPERADPELVEEFAGYGVATIHEAMGKRGLLGRALRPLRPGSRAAGTAVTVRCGPGDNLMIHVAVEQTKPGDLVVITTSEPSWDGFIGELLVTGFAARGVRGIVTTTGVRDVADITAAGFPIWSRAISAQGTSKAFAGTVNCPISIGGTVINPGDIVVADDDGVVCVPRGEAASVAPLAARRTKEEKGVREAMANGALGLDVYGLRPVLERLGIEYVRADSEPDRA